MALPFTNDIRTLRFLADEMTQGDLGERVGVTRQTIAAIEQGKYSPSLEVAFRIAHVFGKPLEAVFQWRSEEHTSELQSLMRISYAVFCLKKKTSHTNTNLSIDK